MCLHIFWKFWEHQLTEWLVTTEKDEKSTGKGNEVQLSLMSKHAAGCTKIPCFYLLEKHKQSA